MERKLTKIKIVIMALLLVGFITGIGCTKADVANAGNEDKLTWSEDFATTAELAKEKNLPILVNFTGSDWCGWCFKLRDEVFATDEFAEYAEKNLVLFKADFPKNIAQTDELKAQNRSLMQKYGVRGFPTIVLLKSDGTLIAQTGYQQGGATKYIEHLNSLLSKE